MEVTVKLNLDWSVESGFVLRVGERVITRANDEAALILVLQKCGLNYEEISKLLLEALVTLPVKIKEMNNNEEHRRDC